MPTYEYECKKCGKHFEIFQSMRDAPLKICPDCGSEVRRLINGGGGVIFKAGGFYSTDKGLAAKKSGDKENAKPEQPAACESCPKNETGACPKSGQ